MSHGEQNTPAIIFASTLVGIASAGASGRFDELIEPRSLNATVTLSAEIDDATVEDRPVGSVFEQMVYEIINERLRGASDHDIDNDVYRFDWDALTLDDPVTIHSQQPDGSLFAQIHTLMIDGSLELSPELIEFEIDGDSGAVIVAADGPLRDHDGACADHGLTGADTTTGATFDAPLRFNVTRNGVQFRVYSVLEDRSATPPEDDETRSGELWWLLDTTGALTPLDTSDLSDWFDVPPGAHDFTCGGAWDHALSVTAGCDTTAIGNGEFLINASVRVEIRLHCPADLDRDGRVDQADLVTLLSQWGCADCPADLNGDGTIDFGDQSILLSSWGDCPNDQ